jgi:hypothetical protein
MGVVYHQPSRLAKFLKLLASDSDGEVLAFACLARCRQRPGRTGSDHRAALVTARVSNEAQAPGDAS